MNTRIASRPSFNGHFFSALHTLITPFFRSEERKKAWLLLLGLLLLLFLVNGINVLLSYLGRDFITALSKQREESFYSILPWYVGGFALATLVAVAYRYVEERMALVWRTWMTQHLLKKYFFGRAYFSLQMRKDIDNPDQRIAEDVRNFTAVTLSLLLIILNSLITVIAFIGVLGSISHTLVVVLVAYAASGTALTFFIGRRLVPLHNRQYTREANFRYGLIRVRENAESIAFYRGEARERVDLARKFQSVYRNTIHLIGWNRNLGFFTTGYNNLSLIIPTIVVAPLFLRGQVEFGVVTQSAGAFAQVLAAMSVIITQFERLSSFAAAVFRLEGLWLAVNAPELREGEDDPEIHVEEGHGLRLNELTVMPPNSDRVLVKDLSLKVMKKSALLIMGPSGTGKSSVLRTIAGLWKSGSGGIERPRLRDIMFLPQRPYMPPGSLRAQVMYPSRENDEADETLKEILKEVNLESVLVRSNGDLSRVLDWGNVLSLGEQQRISFARLIYRSPELAFLDEATSALDEDNESNLYTLARKRGITLVSVGHRSTLQQYHDQVLQLELSGSWHLKAA